MVSIITDKIKDNSIYISGDFLALNKKYLGEGTDFRPVHCTELRKKLISRGCGSECFKFYYTSPEETEELQPREKTYKYKIGIAENYITSDVQEDDGLPIISTELIGGSCPNLLISKSDIEQLSYSVNRTYDTVYEQQRGERNLKINRSTRNNVDIVSDSITISVIDSGTTSTYTNTLDINDLINHSNAPGISAKVDVTYEYSDNTVIGCGNVTFKAFENDDEGNVIKQNQIINKDQVIIEYINGIIRIFPNDDQVNECILSDVIVTYGKLKEDGN